MSYRSLMLTFVLALFSIGLVVTLVANPETSFQAALRGLNIWWEVVFPALLPFIVLSEILMGIGVIHFVGVLLEPLMRPFFNVPGTGGFVLAMGFSSGYPVAAKITARLREQKHITRAEGERLLSLATTGDPLFVIGAVAVGFFHSEQLGFMLALTHYVSAVLLGLMYRFHARTEPASKSLYKQDLPLMLRALQAMHRARLRDGRPLGRLMGEAVHSALQTLLMVGGFIIVFSVVMELLMKINLTQALGTMLTVIMGPFGFPAAFSQSLVIGFFEVTLGAQSASEVTVPISMMWKVAIASAIISWGGLSVHAQVASILSKTDIRVGPYMLARVLHAILSALLTIVAWRPLELLVHRQLETVPVFIAPQPVSVPQVWWHHFSQSALAAFTIFTVLTLVSSLVRKAFVRTYR
ncbi:MAG: sporulation integral membrane protein YlbJ [Brevibacillus sp.]|nr:sporulation integral membrane protein YlbJ [Brevibacillus sp.]